MADLKDLYKTQIVNQVSIFVNPKLEEGQTIDLGELNTLLERSISDFDQTNPEFNYLDFNQPLNNPNSVYSAMNVARFLIKTEGLIPVYKDGEFSPNVEGMTLLECPSCKSSDYYSIDGYHGAFECTDCRQWFNGFGQRLLSPNQWEERMEEPEDY